MTRTRQERGARRRTAILQAALSTIAEYGVSGTTHRAVAQEAGVPLAATTYYFESLDELLDEALLLFVREETERLRALADRFEGQRIAPAELARLLIAELRSSERPGSLPAELAQFELYLEAARRPSLREVARRALELYGEVAEAALRAAGAARPADGARAFVALIDGMGLHRIATGSELDLERALLTLFVPFAMDDAELEARLRQLAE